MVRDRTAAVIAGSICVFALGSALHFTFAWSGAWTPLALIAAVNESVWEHLKIAFWPGLLWAAASARRDGAAHWAAQGVGLFAVSAVIVAVFYGYTAVLGDNYLFVDIATFALAIAIGQVLAAELTPPMRRRGAFRRIGAALLIGQVAAFALFTYLPPPFELFKDPRNGRYGLEANQ